MKESKYWEIKEKLAAYIAEAGLKAGDRLPSEVILAKMFNVSRPTLREYFKILQRDGRITTINGSGSYLLDHERKISNRLNDLKSLGSMICEAGYREAQEILSIDYTAPDDDWVERLSIGRNENVWVLNKIRMADGCPVSMSWTIFPESIIGNVSLGDEIKRNNYSIFDFLEKRMKIYVTAAEAHISALTKKDVYESTVREHLGDDTLKLSQRHFDKDGVRVFLSIDYIRTDMISLDLVRTRKGAEI